MEDAEAAPLLVYECRPVGGLAGGEAVAEAFKDCGVAADRFIEVEDGEGVEVELTPEQVARVIAHLQADSQRFSEIVSVPTAKHAGPRIPSSARAVAGGGEAQGAAETAAPKAAAQPAVEPESAPAEAAGESPEPGKADQKAKPEKKGKAKKGDAKKDGKKGKQKAKP